MTSDSRNPTTEQAAREAERILGWKHLVKYAGMPQEWMDRTMRAIVGAVLAHQAPATDTEATEVERYLVHRSHLVRPAGTDGIDGWLATGWVWVTGDPWREVSR